MNISLLCPTRGNVRGLRRLLDSLSDLTEYPEQVELLLKVDLDDPELPSIKRLLCEYDTVQHSLYIEERTDDLTKDYHNYMAVRAKGVLLMAFNDDARMATPGWDHRLMEALGTRTYAFVRVKDTTPGRHRFPCFPVLTKTLVDALGWYFCPGPRMWGSDNLLWGLYQHSGLVVNCLDVVVEHARRPDAARDARHSAKYWEDYRNRVFPYDLTPAMMTLYRKGIVTKRVVDNIDLKTGAEV